MLTKPPLAQILKDFGLEENEAGVYLANLVLGAATVQEVAKKSGVKRTTIYSLLDTLKEKGLVSVFRQGTKTYLVPEDPTHLERVFDERYQRMKDSIPAFRSLYRTAAIKPKIKFYEGREGIRQVYEDTLDEGKEILCLSGWHSMVEAMPAYWDRYIRARVKRGIRVRALADRSEESRYYQEREKEELRELRFLPSDALPFTTEVNIYGNKVAMLTFGTEFIGVILESEEIANTWRMVFEVIWNCVNEEA